jgi:hypothetical protein
MTEWEIKAKEFANCNCAYGCPCQFNGLPSKGHCEAVVAMEIEQGHHGDVKLDGLRFGAVFQWPGAVHEGRGHCQPFVMATVFAVYFSTLEKVYDPIFAPIAFDVDVEARRGRYAVPGLVESHGEPIRNPVTGAEHRARIDLPDGFEYELAEIGSGTSKTEGNVRLDLKSSYAQFAHLHLNNHGVVRHRTV